MTMPNNTTNYLYVEGSESDVNDLVDLLVTSDGGKQSRVDFNQIVPMPEPLNIECGSAGDQAYELLYSEGDEWKRMLSYSWVPADIETREQLVEFIEANHPLDRELGKAYHENLQNYGHKTWYSWCVEHWGTKWNAYGYTEVNRKGAESVEIQFETAWSPPVPIYEALHERFPNLEITACWSDEGSYEREEVFHGEPV